MRAVALTTEDNPFDPFEEFDQWNAFDQGKGYDTCSYLARIAKSSDELSEEEQLTAVEQAIDEIIELNLTGNYKKVEKED
jgi:hypothetical protein